jgi:hypothetical protein
VAKESQAVAGQMATVVASVIGQAIDQAGKALALAAKIEPLLGRTYAGRTVSAWSRGDVMPPADAVFAAAKVTGISLDEKLGVGREPTEIERRLASLEGELAELKQQVTELEVQRMDREAAEPATSSSEREAAGGRRRARRSEAG